MMITVDDLSKRYMLGYRNQKPDGLRHLIEGAARAPLDWLRRGGRRERPPESEFWALEDVSFTVPQGEVVGIIGRNGAGKSTLLKLLSRITEPTRGRIQLRGRVASLLEVGTGFHPELTGRENIYLNGSILGMGRNEIRSKFDEIVGFSGVERFLETPVKRYSSGMYVRLAFAVAAHLEPEILIVDEVLAVGDSAFQKKCLAKMDDVGHSGRTVLFVSHNMQSVMRLCGRCILLENGRVTMDGESHAVAGVYQGTGQKSSAVRVWNEAEAPGDPVVRLREVRSCGESGEPTASFNVREPIRIEIQYEILESGHRHHPHFAVMNEDGVVLFVAQDTDPEWRGLTRPAGVYTSRCTIPGNFFNEGGFSVSPVMMTLEPETVHGRANDAVFFRVIDDFESPETSRGEFQRPVPGLLRPSFEWRTKVSRPAVALAD